VKVLFEDLVLIKRQLLINNFVMYNTQLFDIFIVYR
jgi:hypothetical protein